MKRVIEYRKLLEVDKNVTLKELKTIYRNSMKDSHPDKFVNDEIGKLAAEETSKNIINAYHFLVSISTETVEKNLPEYTDTITNSNIHNFNLDKQTLHIKFLTICCFIFLSKLQTKTFRQLQFYFFF